MCLSSTKTERVSLNEFTSEKMGIDMAKTSELNLILGSIQASKQRVCLLKVSPKWNWFRALACIGWQCIYKFSPDSHSKSLPYQHYERFAWQSLGDYAPCKWCSSLDEVISVLALMPEGIGAPPLFAYSFPPPCFACPWFYMPACLGRQKASALIGSWDTESHFSFTMRGSPPLGPTPHCTF